jgi:hypothetical protein
MRITDGYFDGNFDNKFVSNFGDNFGGKFGGILMKKIRNYGSILSKVSDVSEMGEVK